jgi:methylglyoxal synthase
MIISVLKFYKAGDSMATIALIAHDRKKDSMLAFVKEHEAVLKSHTIYATATTGRIIKENTSLHVTSFLSGPLGGDQQIGARIASQEVDLVVFLRDPLTAQPHEPDITALLRVCDVHNVPVATNEACGHLLIASL